jgi:hypothetical protein
MNKPFEENQLIISQVKVNGYYPIDRIAAVKLHYFSEKLLPLPS